MSLRQVCIFALYFLFCQYEVQGCKGIASECKVLATVEAGNICGTIRNYNTSQGDLRVYASFRGVPYAEQPVGDLRFKPLQPSLPWAGILDAAKEGPICPQTISLYEELMQPQGTSEACMFANIHVPIKKQSSDVQSWDEGVKMSGLPVFVFVHGGGFSYGSGDADLYGPEYLLSKDIIVVTFNYRINVMGFLSLNTAEVPGNNGLRDIVTLLKWVKTNIASFGGNPDEITIGGQSAGAAAVHLLTLSSATEGLFKRAICMSGTAVRTFYSLTQTYSQTVLQSFLTGLNITATDTEQIYQQLKEAPLSNLLEVNRALINGIGSFNPVIENKFEGVTRIIDDDTEKLIEQGRGRDVPILFSYTKSECDVFRKRFTAIDIASRAKQNKMLIVPVPILFSTASEALPEKIQKVEAEYFKTNITIDTYINYCSDSSFMYPAIYSARKRAEIGGAPVYVNQYSYKGDYRVLEKALELDLNEPCHVEDLTDLFKSNSITEPSERSQADLDMQFWLPELYSNFVKTGNPSPNWPSLKTDDLKYQDIRQPKVFEMSPLTEQQRRAVEFFDQLYENQ